MTGRERTGRCGAHCHMVILAIMVEDHENCTVRPRRNMFGSADALPLLSAHLAFVTHTTGIPRTRCGLITMDFTGEHCFYRTQNRERRRPFLLRQIITTATTKPICHPSVLGLVAYVQLFLNLGPQPLLVRRIRLVLAVNGLWRSRAVYLMMDSLLLQEACALVSGLLKPSHF